MPFSSFYWIKHLPKSLTDQSKLSAKSRSSHPEMFLGKSVLKICSKFTGENPCRSVVSIKLLCNFIETTFRHGCSPVNLLHIFRTPFLKNLLDGCFWNSNFSGDLMSLDYVFNSKIYNTGIKVNPDINLPRPENHHWKSHLPSAFPLCMIRQT